MDLPADLERLRDFTNNVVATTLFVRGIKVIDANGVDCRSLRGTKIRRMSCNTLIFLGKDSLTFCLKPVEICQEVMRQ